MFHGGIFFEFFSTYAFAQGDSAVPGRREVRDFFGVVTAGLGVIWRLMVSDELAGAVSVPFVVVLAGC